jgi:mRNA-degrading endonuclease toxin of MazEF toxin-antitoxin module
MLEQACYSESRATCAGCCQRDRRIAELEAAAIRRDQDVERQGRLLAQQDEAMARKAAGVRSRHVDE